MNSNQISIETHINKSMQDFNDMMFLVKELLFEKSGKWHLVKSMRTYNEIKKVLSNRERNQGFRHQ